MVFPKPEETAVLIVNGMRFTDWETVMVRHAMKEQPPFKCRFTCSEGVPLSKNFAVMRIKPGDQCTVILAGILAFSGRVETRQVYYDAQRHHIEIQAATFVEVATTSVISQTMEWKDKTFQQIGQDVLGKVGLNLVFEGGGPPGFVFPRVSAPHGISIHDFLDTLARGLSTPPMGISFTSNVGGDFVVAMGPSGGGDQVVEGWNIIIGREIIYNPSMASSAPVISQGPGNDQDNMAKVAHTPFASQAAQMIGSVKGAGAIVNELPMIAKEHLQGRSGSEGAWQAGDQITVFATVYGWLRPSGGLWERNQHVSVTSPMLIMEGQDLRAKAVVFTQDDKTGTRTTLELCNDAAFGGQNPDIK